jgi:hypothetical protein
MTALTEKTRSIRNMGLFCPYNLYSFPMKKRLVFSILVFFSIFNLKAETLNDSITHTTAKKISSHSFYSGVGYGSNMLYSGYSLSKDQPYYSTDLLYSFKRKWTASFSIYNLNGEQPAIAFYDFSIGYRHIFNHLFDAGITLSNYFTSKSIQNQYFGNFSYLTVSGGLDWKIVYTKAVYSTILDSEGGHYLQLKNSHFFVTPDFIKDRAYISFNPTVNFVFGDLYKLGIFTTDNQGTGFGPGFLNPGEPETVEAYSSSFGLMDLELSLPVSLNYGKLSLDIEPLYYLPIHKDPDFPSQKGFIMYLNLFFRII